MPLANPVGHCIVLKPQQPAELLPGAYEREGGIIDNSLPMPCGTLACAPAAGHTVTSEADIVCLAQILDSPQDTQ